MIPRNTMQRGGDKFAFRRRALLKTREPWDTTGETKIFGFEIGGTEPEGANRRIIFEVDGKLWKFGSSGLVSYGGYGEITDILEGGNTVAELLAVNNVPAWLGKKIYPIIALDAPEDALVMPKIKIALKVNSFNDIYTKAELSPVYELKTFGETARIFDLAAEKTLNGRATATVTARLKSPYGVWSDWAELDTLEFKDAAAIQFKNTYVLTTLDGTDEAQVNSVACSYSTDATKLSGNTFEVFTQPQEYYQPLGTCYALIKHSELHGANIRAYVTFANPATRRENISLGAGTGDSKIYYLPDENVEIDSLQVQANGQNIVGFYYNTEENFVQLAAGEGAEITASYNCGAEAESWSAMVKSYELQNNEVFSTRFTYQMPASQQKKISKVKFSVTRQTGRVFGEELGAATGKIQTFALPHKAKKESITLNGDWLYDEETQILKVQAPLGTNLSLSYDWIGEIPDIFEYVAGWSPAG